MRRPGEDEIHLIAEYPEGARFGAAVAPRANRFIAHSDTSNAELLAIDQLVQAVTAQPDARPSLVVVSGTPAAIARPPLARLTPPRAPPLGLHLLESLPADARPAAVSRVLGALASLPAGVPVHVEIASMQSAAFAGTILRSIAPLADSIGASDAGGGTSARASLLCHATH